MNAPPQRESRLLAKARQLGLAGPEDLERLAIERGCDYYDLRSHVREPAADPVLPSGLSNEELAVGLLAAQHRNLLRTRLAAAMLGAPGNNASTIARLSMDEGCAEIVRHIASCGHHVEPHNSFWAEIMAALVPDVQQKPEEHGGFPHISRFVEMTGISRGTVGTQMRWIRPSKRAVYA